MDEDEMGCLEAWLERRWMGRDMDVLLDAGFGSVQALRDAVQAGRAKEVIALFSKSGHRLKMRIMLDELAEGEAGSAKEEENAAPEEEKEAPPAPAEPEPEPEPAPAPAPEAAPAPEPEQTTAEAEEGEEEPGKAAGEDDDAVSTATSAADYLPPVLMADSDDSDMEEEVEMPSEDSDSDADDAEGGGQSAAPEPVQGEAEDIPVPSEEPPAPPAAEADVPDLPDSDGEEDAADAPAASSDFKKRLAMFQGGTDGGSGGGGGGGGAGAAPGKIKVSTSADIRSRMGNVAAALAKGPPPAKVRRAPEPAASEQKSAKAGPPPLPAGAGASAGGGGGDDDGAAPAAAPVAQSASATTLYHGDFDLEDEEAPQGFELPPVSALGDAQKQGVLEKRGVGYVNRQFKERHILLKGRDLYWLKSLGDQFPAGAIRLTEPGLQLKLLDARTLEIKTKRKTYVFRADSDKEMTGWLQAMRMAQHKNQGRRGSVAVQNLSSRLDDKSRRLLGILKVGAMFIKFKHKKGKERMIWVPASMDRIVWGSSDRKTAKGFMLIQDVVRISEGCFGSSRNENAFTVVSRQRTLELEATSSQEKADWIEGINFLLTNRDALAA